MNRISSTHAVRRPLSPLEDSPRLVNLIAPEHVEFAVDEPERLSDRVRHAGAIFLGRYAPEAIGDYVAGSNHVLPTSRAARFSSGLSVFDFLNRTSIIRCDAEAFARLAQMHPNDFGRLFDEERAKEGLGPAGVAPIGRPPKGDRP